MKLQYIGTTTKYDVEISAIKSNVIQVIGSLPMKEKGFNLYDSRGNIYDYSAYKTLYRAVTGGYQFSNNGETWDEPHKTVSAIVIWQDEDNFEGYRPSEVTITVKDNGSIIDDPVMSDDNEWKKDYSILESHELTVEADAVTNYEMTIDGSTVTYQMEMPLEPTVEEQIALLEEVVMDLDDRVSALEG